MSLPSKSRALHKKRRNKKWARHPEDWYVEPTWCDDRLFQVEKFGCHGATMTIDSPEERKSRS